MSLNRVEISGGLVRDPELRYTSGGYPVMDFTVAVNGTRYDSQKREQVVTTSFIAVNVWGPLAEQYADLDMQKGDEVYVLGRLEQRTIEKKDGQKESKTRVTAMMVHHMKPKTDAGYSAPRTAGPAKDEPPLSAYDPTEEPF